MKILVTGATSGIGLATARALAAKGHEVLVHGRSEARGQQALDSIRSAHPAARVQLELCDLASLDAVRAWAERLRGEPLDVMVNGMLVAHGEVVVVNEKFGIRLTDVISAQERVKKLR